VAIKSDIGEVANVLGSQSGQPARAQHNMTTALHHLQQQSYLTNSRVYMQSSGVGISA
jgi:hypothetical protein